MISKPIELHEKNTSRGRPTERGETKRATINMRTTPAIRAALEEAAASEGRSLAQEIEQRLERSIAADAVRGGVHNVRLVDAIAAEIATIEGMTGKRWNDDQVTFQLMLLSIPELLKLHGPMIENGPKVVAIVSKAKEARGRHIAARSAMERDGLMPVGGTIAAMLSQIGSNTIHDFSPRSDEELDSLRLTLLNNHIPDERKEEFNTRYAEFSQIARERRAYEDALSSAYQPQIEATQQAAQMFKNIRKVREEAETILKGV